MDLSDSVISDRTWYLQASLIRIHNLIQALNIVPGIVYRTALSKLPA